MLVGQCILRAFKVKFFTCVDGVMYVTCVVVPFVTLATYVHGSLHFTCVTSEVLYLCLWCYVSYLRCCVNRDVSYLCLWVSAFYLRLKLSFLLVFTVLCILLALLCHL